MGENILNPQDLAQNPIGDELAVEVSIPKKIEIKMVDASSLGDYEVWVFIASLICNFLVGFVVATFSAGESSQGAFIAFDILCLILLGLSIFMAIRKRRKMNIERKTIPLAVKKSLN